jgi:hypothetical protein
MNGTRAERFAGWRDGLLAAVSQNLTGLEPDGDLDPILLMGTEAPDGSAGDLIMAPLDGVIGTADWENFKTMTLPSVIAEREAKLVGVVTMGWKRTPPDMDSKTECVFVVTGCKGVSVESHVAEVTRLADGPPKLGEWDTDYGPDGSVAAAVALGLAAQDRPQDENL